MTETQLLHLLFQRAPAELPDARLFRRNVGLYYTKDGRPVRVGVEGQADAYALLRGGLVVEIETKAARGRMSVAQERWAEFCARWEIAHVVLTAPKFATPDRAVAEWITTLRCTFAALTRTTT